MQAFSPPEPSTTTSTPDIGGNSAVSAAIVVCYHPTQAHLANLRVLRPQVQRLIVVDNASPRECIIALRSLQNEIDFEIIENAENLGIARALNQGITTAIQGRAKFIHLFDQDSQVTEDYIQTMVKDYSDLSLKLRLALLVPRYKDPHTGSERLFQLNEGTVPSVAITSGTLLTADIFEQCGPFAESLFIYTVDDEYSLRVQAKGLSIRQSKRATLLHTAGDPKPYRLFNRTWFVTTNHSPTARYYLNRNRVWLARHYCTRFPKYCVQIWLFAIKETTKILLAEEEKTLKLKRTLQGVIDGVLGRTGRANLT